MTVLSSQNIDFWFDKLQVRRPCIYRNNCIHIYNLESGNVLRIQRRNCCLDLPQNVKGPSFSRASTFQEDQSESC